MRYLICILFFLQLTHSAHGQGWLWAKGSTGGFDAWGVKTDPVGNVFVAGMQYLQEDTYFGTYDLPNISNLEQSILAKYDANGNFLWAIGSQNSDSWVTNIATDHLGNVYMLGAFTSTTMAIGNIILNNTLGGAIQAYLIKVDANSTILWAKTPGGSTYQFLVGSATPPITAYVMSTGALTVDTANNVYIACDFKTVSETIDNIVINNNDASGNTHDVTMAKYGPSGTLFWAKDFGGVGDDYAFGITVTPAGSIYLSGIFSSQSITLGNTTITSNTNNSVSAWTAYIARFDAQGNPIWGTSSGGIGKEFATGICSDADNNVYVTGGFAENINFAGTAITSPYSEKYSLFLVKLDEANTVNWFKTAGDPLFADNTFGYTIATSRCGAVWVGGSMGNFISIDGNQVPSYGGNGSDPVFISGFTDAGTYINTTTILSGADDETHITCDEMGNVYIGGDIKSSIPIGNTQLPAPSWGEGMYVAKFATVNVIPDTIKEHTDTTFCSLFNKVLNGPAGSIFYIWSDGKTGSMDTISNSGTYWVMAYGNCEQNVILDTFHVTIATADTFVKITDTIICSTQAALRGPVGYLSYLWNDGSTADTNIISGIGKYWLTAEKNCRVFTDTFNVMIGPPGDTLITRKDTVIYPPGNSIALKVPGSHTAYSWNTGDTTNAIYVHNAGEYWVIAIGKNCLEQSLMDTFYVTQGHDLTFSLGNDTLVCNPVTLSAPLQNAIYLWQDGSSNNSYMVSATGTYWVLASSAGCQFADSVYVTLPDLSQHVHDTTVCKDDMLNLILNANVPAGATALWNTGSTSPSINVTDTGLYAVIVKEDICADSASIRVDEVKCDCRVDMPTAFTPNNDNKNDYYHPIPEPECPIANYKFCIFNRFGQIVFTTTDLKGKWDGTFNGTPCDVDTYMYMLEYTAGLKKRKTFQKRRCYTHSLKNISFS